jgi:hypothetical protein
MYVDRNLHLLYILKQTQFYISGMDSSYVVNLRVEYTGLVDGRVYYASQ